ncbi:MAG: hypothetical protein QG622_3677 [Actinomycetota bacterium]|nr:hypothetical protein [Actinomycetota bacterium]
MTSDWAQMGMASVAASVRELGESLDVVAGQLPGIVEAINQLDEDVERLVTERGETGAALGRHERDLRELTATVKRLSAQVTWIEQHIRSSGTAQVLDLDHVEEELGALAATADAGHRAADQLLSTFERAALEASVTDHRDAAARSRAAVRSLLDSCVRLVATVQGDPEHRQARSDYLAARGARAEALREVDLLAPDAEEARERLSADDTERARLAPTVTAGERADVELLTRLRTKLTAAVGEGALLPAWLTEPLGPRPPAGESRRWMDVAAGIMAYRITYGVDDAEDPLGDLPESVGGYRRRWHADLGRGIRELRR